MTGTVLDTISPLQVADMPTKMRFKKKNHRKAAAAFCTFAPEFSPRGPCWWLEYTIIFSTNNFFTVEFSSCFSVWFFQFSSLLFGDFFYNSPFDSFYLDLRSSSGALRCEFHLKFLWIDSKVTPQNHQPLNVCMCMKMSLGRVRGLWFASSNSKGHR